MKFIAKLLKLQVSAKKKIGNEAGRQGENIAANFLKNHGFKIIQRNYRCSTGEIDIIAKDGKTFVFVEVKTRSENSDELPEAALTQKKRHRLCKAAQHFMNKYKLEEPLYRFDLVGIEFNHKNEWKINHWENVVDYKKGLVRRY